MSQKPAIFRQAHSPGAGKARLLGVPPIINGWPVASGQEEVREQSRPGHTSWPGMAWRDEGKMDRKRGQNGASLQEHATSAAMVQLMYQQRVTPTSAARGSQARNALNWTQVFTEHQLAIRVRSQENPENVAFRSMSRMQKQTLRRECSGNEAEDGNRPGPAITPALRRPCPFLPGAAVVSSRNHDTRRRAEWPGSSPAPIESNLDGSCFALPLCPDCRRNDR